MIRSRERRAELAAGRRTPWWIRHLQQAPIAVLTAIGLCAGGLLLMGFFLRIRFMPDVDLAGSTALLMAAALVGLGTMCGAVFILAVPGLTSRYFLDEARLEAGNAALALVALPAFLSMIFIVFDAIYFKDAPLLGSWTTWGVAGVIVIAALLGAPFMPVGKRSDGSAPAVRYLSKVWALGAAGFMWLLGMLMAVDFSLQFAADSDRAELLVLLVVAVWLLLVIGFNVATARLSMRDAWFAGPAMGLLSFFVLVLMTGSFTTFSAATVRALGFGEVNNVDLVIAGPACDALRLSAATALRCDAGVPGAQGVLRGVMLRSRIGSQMVVEPSGTPSAATGRAIFRKEDVVMWMVRGSTPKGR